MQIINTIDSNYFELNGIKYAKIYQPLTQGVDAFGIYNIYDTKQQLVNSLKYNEYNINGTVYNNIDDAIDNLLPVIWTENLIVSGNYVINNNPDNEDIEEVANVLKLKDRSNAVGEYGYKIIREDFDFESIPASYENSIWDIRYNHDLNNADITLPNNVILFFNGGKIINYGLIELSNTRIRASEVLVFDSLEKIDGEFLNKIIYPAWFGLAGSPVVTSEEINTNVLNSNTSSLGNATSTSLDSSTVDTDELILPQLSDNSSSFQEYLLLNSTTKKVEKKKGLVWENLTLLNNWLSAGNEYYRPRAARTVNDVVFVQAYVNGGLIDTNIFVLPVALRPEKDLIFVISSMSGFVKLSVNTSGEVKTIQSGINTDIYIEINYLL